MQGFFITAKEMKPIGKLPNILRQAHQAIADVADNADSWRAFLRSAAYTTHYAFPNQALIYSQRPGATMLADIDTWNRAAGRLVNRGAHGVASLGTGKMAGNVRYLFDIKDTHPAGKGAKPLGWQITDANRYSTLQALQEKHNAESLPEIFGLRQPCLWHSTANNWTTICKMP